ncbi:MAG: CRISPR system precrRNA processing endoribonuclease RAMP protein Cas6 [Alphaproteobacteria bacterium]|nr:CRISPR system precrRNA processing endoribonuclease RAMP protein Cas6 [Alphaproteobacteria bacterium]
MRIELPLIKLEFTFKAVDEINFPFYSGSALRGVFGSTLRKVCCLSGKPECDGCGLRATCPYSIIFETQSRENGRSVNPYVIEPQLNQNRTIKPGETFTFSQIIFGDCIKSLSFILLSWVRGMQFGIGKSKSKAELISVYQKHPYGDKYIYGQEEDTLQPLNPTYILDVPENRSNIKLHIQTPLRIQRDKHPIVPDSLTIGDFASSLIRRVELLYSFHTSMPSFMNNKYELLEQAKKLQEVSRNLKWQDWTRWSGRQKTHIALGGVIGEWEFSGDLSNLLPLFYAGELLHLGKSTVMGLGKYVIE